MNLRILDYVNPSDWRQPAAVPRTAYQIGFDDARYGDVYYNPYLPTSIAHGEYDSGHQDGMHSREETNA